MKEPSYGQIFLAVCGLTAILGAVGMCVEACHGASRGRCDVCGQKGARAVRMCDQCMAEIAKTEKEILK